MAPCPRSRGFTLVELMVVVVIVGILATIGLVALRSHVFGSKTVEAFAMVQSIRAAQERWRAEHLVYLDVSQSETFYPADPRSDTSRIQRTFHVAAGKHSDAVRWHLLNPTVSSGVEFGYMTNAGGPGDTMTAPEVSVPGLVWPTPNEHWYVIQAIADVDHDGTPAFFLASSIKGEVYRQNEGE